MSLSFCSTVILTHTCACLCLSACPSVCLLTPVVDRCIFLCVCLLSLITPVVDHFFWSVLLWLTFCLLIYSHLWWLFYISVCLSFYSHLLLTIVFCLCVCLSFLFTPVKCFTGGISRDSGPWIPGHTLHAHALELQHTPPQKVTTNHKALYIEIIKNNCTDWPRLMFLCRERKGPVDYADTFHLSLISGPKSFRRFAGAGR